LRSRDFYTLPAVTPGAKTTPVSAKHAGKIVAISGGASGIGQAIVRRLAQEGARVAIADVADCAQTVELVRQAGGEASGFLVDISSWEQVCGFADQVRARYGVALIAVHCAALQFMSAFDELSSEQWRATHEVNVLGGFHLAKAFLPAMKAERWGRIVMVASSSFFAPPPRMTHYIASKGALLGLVRGLAAEVGEFGITVNALAPGLTRTSKAIAGVPQAHFDEVRNRQSIKRSGEPQDQAAAISFMVSDDAGFMSGQTMLVDGGEGHV
jgi:NAD(P)-dependent dehydrogenase (short-subunit alcohol dehydrogenase family)